MGIGELFTKADEIISLIKLIIDTIELFEDEEREIKGFVTELKECVEGPLFTTLEEIAETMDRWCKELVKALNDLFSSINLGAESTKKTDQEGSELLKEALGM